MKETRRVCARVGRPRCPVGATTASVFCVSFGHSRAAGAFCYTSHGDRECLDGVVAWDGQMAKENDDAC